jgi:hypothetical protein
LLAGLLAPAASAAQAQESREPRPQVDPYTQGKPKALAKAGYLSLGPFQLATGHSTEQVVQDLGGEPLLWAETAHFKLGCSLDRIPLPEDPQLRKFLIGELERLGKRIPGLRRRPKELDPWLRLHLYAQRMEELHARFCEVLDLSDEEFAAGKGAGVGSLKEIGGGPHLGMHGKPIALVFEKTAAMSRYATLYLGGPTEKAFRKYFDRDDAFLFMTSMEQLAASYDNDGALYCTVAFGVVQNLVNGFRGYTHNAPVWLEVGLARWFMRDIDPRWQLYTAPPGDFARGEHEVDWAPKVRARVEHRYFPTTKQMLAWKDPNALSFAEHMVLWSRIDYLIRRDDGRTMRELLWRAMEPVPHDGAGTLEEVAAMQAERALRDATGMDLEAFDEAWAAWVLEEYPAK